MELRPSIERVIRLNSSCAVKKRFLAPRFCVVSRKSLGNGSLEACCANGIQISRHNLNGNVKICFPLNKGSLTCWKPRQNSSIITFSSMQDDSDVPELTAQEFLMFLKQKKRVFVFFYDPFCPHCRFAEPEFQKVAQMSSVPCVKIYGPENEQFCKSIGINVFPTFRYFTSNGTVKWVEFQGEKKRKELLTFLNSVSGGSKVTSSKLACRQYSSKSCHQEALHNKIIELTASNIKEQLEGKSVLVFFYASWCSEYDEVLKEFSDASCKLTDDVGYLATCNAAANLDIKERFHLKSFPTIKYFYNSQYVADFQGLPVEQNITKFMRKMKRSQQIKSEMSQPLNLTHCEKVMIWKGLDGAENIVHITSENLEKILQKYNSLLILFYACWSKSCLEMKNEYARAAKQLNRNIGVFAACDIEDNADIADRFIINRFPTFKYFYDGKYIMDYEGVPTEDNFLKFMKDPSRVPEKSKTVIKPSASKIALTGNIPRYWLNIIGAESLVFVTDYNFKALLKTYNTVLIMFYVSWCKACSLMKAEYGKAAYALPKNTGCAIAACDAEENNLVADTFFVTKLPALKMFKSGKFVGNYVGLRTERDILYYVKEVSKRDVFLTEDFKDKQPKREHIKRIAEMAIFWRNVEGGHQIILINECNFKLVVEQNPSVLIMFYYPLVAGIELVKKEFGASAKILHKEFGSLAAYHYKENDPICKDYKITYKDLPVFKYFKNGSFEKNYEGDKTEECFLKFMKEPTDLKQSCHTTVSKEYVSTPPLRKREC